MSENQSLKREDSQRTILGRIQQRYTTVAESAFGIFLARLLTPADYGMVGMLAIFSLIASSIQESGFTAALVNKKR